MLYCVPAICCHGRGFPLALQILQIITTGPDACSYLSGQLACMQYARIGEMAPGDYTGKLSEGWFKFGSHLQRPLCHWCRMCYSMRVPLDEWRPNRTHRRLLRRLSHLEVKVETPPVFSADRLALYNRYRLAQRVLRGWHETNHTESGYIQEFINGPVPMTEITVWDGGRLLAVLMADNDVDLMTAVTHFHEPSEWRRSVGLFAVLQSFLHAQRLGKKWLYLGYYVPGSPSMGYKQQFHPCELRSWDGGWTRQDA